MASHLSSSSVPSSPRSSDADVERQLQSLEATISSSSATINTICACLKRLGNIYISIEEMICRPSNKINLCQAQQRNAVEEELAQSLVILDLCSAMQENFLELKMVVQELLMVLKRGDSAANQFKAYIQLTKKARKYFKKACKKSSIEMPKWSLIYKTSQKGKAVCKKERLQALECSIGDLESGVELLFRGLIQSRVSLLNTLSS
ncbi:hypothetical protein PR202_ga10477 [Eleusine coracana subsp. coracana]|uniref:Uncharacterized protein n=1 Tax=Eleusine coracana subsp. coracana TaxID=191504 RepID=A0AAV5C6U2_ELECO|nr:hypothetical protein PR202_ga10477 [Eleusine coracana subsp. coracana]